MTPKQSFINTELWLLTFGGAFQLAKVYGENFKLKSYLLDYRFEIKHFFLLSPIFSIQGFHSL